MRTCMETAAQKITVKWGDAPGWRWSARGVPAPRQPTGRVALAEVAENETKLWKSMGKTCWSVEEDMLNRKMGRHKNKRNMRMETMKSKHSKAKKMNQEITHDTIRQRSDTNPDSLFASTTQRFRPPCSRMVYLCTKTRACHVMRSRKRKWEETSPAFLPVAYDPWCCSGVGCLCSESGQWYMSKIQRMRIAGRTNAGLAIRWREPAFRALAVIGTILGGEVEVWNKVSAQPASCIMFISLYPLVNAAVGRVDGGSTRCGAHAYVFGTCVEQC
jgi:hypothetical protein